MPPLALSLIAALIGALAGSRLRMPSLVGYLLGGVLIGPFTSRLVPNAHLAQEIAELPSELKPQAHLTPLMMHMEPLKMERIL
ncbi:MAG: hypothetical protein JO251_08450 [Verrucomicrobia bacterium]|nr:hypothetical protein [Verrucomicrobiota bacterium]